MSNTMDSRDRNKNTITKVGTTSVPDHCTSCPWLNRQPEGNKMLCILPGNCFWLEGWKNGEVKQD